MHFITPEGYIRPESIAHFRNRALGGAACVTLGEAAVDQDRGRSHFHNVNLQDINNLPYLTQMTDAIHQAGAIASIEIEHGGKYAFPHGQRRQKPHCSFRLRAPQRSGRG